MQTQEIHALVRRVQAGDKAAATEILSLFRPLICKAAGQSHLREVREDAEQEALPETAEDTKPETEEEQP